MHYRRPNAPGATVFITANLNDQRSNLLIEHIDHLRDAVRHVKARFPFEIEAIVVMPDHIHMLMTLPEGDGDFSFRVGAIKATFSRRIPRTEPLSESRLNKRERGIWQRRFWEHLIRDEADYENHVAYIHINPVKHGYVHRAIDWPHSSIHRYVAAGIIAEDWAAEAEDEGFGER